MAGIALRRLAQQPIAIGLLRIGHVGLVGQLRRVAGELEVLVERQEEQLEQLVLDAQPRLEAQVDHGQPALKQAKDRRRSEQHVGRGLQVVAGQREPSLAVGQRFAPRAVRAMLGTRERASAASSEAWNSNGSHSVYRRLRASYS